MATKGVTVKYGEIGQSGVAVYNGLITGEEYNPLVSGQRGLKVWEEMRRSDPTVRQSLWAIKHPLTQAEWRVEPASDSAADKSAAELVDYNLFNLLNWTLALEVISNYLEFGHGLHEMVIEPREVNGKLRIVVSKLGYRKATTIQKWETEDGKPGITQATPDGTMKSIPDANLLRFTNQQEGDNYEGISLLRTAYKPWFSKSRLEMIELVGHERQAVGIPEAHYPPNATTAEKEKVRKLLRNLRANEEQYMLTPIGWETGFMDMKAGTTRDVSPAIEKYDRQILRNVFAQFLELGASAAGSRSTSEDHSRFFEMALESVARYIQSVVNDKLIPTLVDLNFNVTEYPKLQHGHIGDENLPVLSEAVSKFVAATALHPRPEDENVVRKLVGWPELSDKEIKELKKQAEEARKRLEQAPTDPNATKQDGKNTDGKTVKADDKDGDLKASVLLEEAAALKTKLDKVLYGVSTRKAA